MERTNDMEDLSKKLSAMKTQEERLDLLYERIIAVDLTKQSKQPGILMLGGDQSDKMKCIDQEYDQIVPSIHALAERYNLQWQLAERVVSNALHGPLSSNMPSPKPMKTMLCANVDPNLYKRCQNAGVRACAGCRLVLYCNSQCQKAHWHRHKRDCKGFPNSKNWAPQWFLENRFPVFSSETSPLLGTAHERAQGLRPVGLGISLWGNIPAIDLLNLEKNEGVAYQGDLSLLFSASGDLRNILVTINGVPPDYSGKLSVVVNDHNPYVVARNLLLLMVITGVNDESLAADIALHLWYSAFIPLDYDARIRLVAAKFIRKAASTSTGARLDWNDGNTVGIVGTISDMTLKLLTSYVRESQLDTNKAHKHRRDIMFTPHRVDYRDRVNCQLSPAHRAAIHQYRNFGLVLPFGAANAHFNTTNKTLFNEEGIWLQDDMSLPLEGWDLNKVTIAGRTKGATEGDLFGCLYFHLREQLVKFKKQLGRLKVDFHIVDIDCRELAAGINTPGSHPVSTVLPTKFDRIEVSNTVDDSYVGFEHTLSDWGPHLNRNNPSSTLLAYTMNWVYDGGEGKPDQDDAAYLRIMKRMQQEQRFKHIPKDQIFHLVSPASIILQDNSPVMYENSKAFKKYLAKRQVPKTAASLGLQMKSKHSITPPRPAIPLEASLSTLPTFSSDEEWYRKVCLAMHNHYIRFLEFTPSNV